MGVNVPNFGPGTEPGVLRRWAQTVEGLGFDLLMVSGHIAVTPDVAEKYPAPFYEPFTTLAWLADALGVPFARRGKLTDDYLRAVRAAWEDDENYRGGQIPIWVGGNSDAGLRRAVRLGEAWHPLRFTLPWLREAVRHMAALADELGRPVPGLAPRIALRLAETPVTDPGRLAGEGTIDQILDDLAQLRLLGADTVVLDPFSGDPGETHRPETAWQALATVAAAARHLGE
jgi:alkanesulfonate monooxygenase SsuD/methylene tetrahydromethanopterin reductase-like flavin-dependent oxidoreductase (luciferase family)